MNAKTVVEATHGILDKARDFSHFVLFGTFVLFLDSVLVVFKNTALVDVTLNYLKESISIGAILIFVCSFFLFVSFIVGAVKVALTGILLFVPYKWIAFFHGDQRWTEYRKDYVFQPYLKRFAVLNNNSVAYQEYVNWKTKQVNDNLEHYSLAFLIASLFNVFAWTRSDNAILNILFSVDRDSGIFSADALIMALASVLYLALFYLGICVGCALKQRSREDDYVYLPNHGIDGKK